MRFELGEAIGVDLARRTVTVRHPLTHDSKLVEYDELVLAVGATDSTMGVPGVEKFAVPLKTIADAQIVRSRVVGALEAAATTSDLPRGIVSCDLSWSEGTLPGSNSRANCLHSYTRFCSTTRASIAQRSSWSCWSPARVCSDTCPTNLESTRQRRLSKRGAELRLNEEVSAIDGRGVELKSGEHIASGTVIWAAGEKPSPLAEILGLKTNKHGAIETGPDFVVAGTPHVWALGDCAAVPRPKGGTYAPLAQIAMREGPFWLAIS